MNGTDVYYGLFCSVLVKFMSRRHECWRHRCSRYSEVVCRCSGSRFPSCSKTLIVPGDTGSLSLFDCPLVPRAGEM